ncbi:Predicted transcriptional regulator [Candidatus Ornithobacterium hominis]|uniref:Predicted transcriptional regulator n=1 Tax=Candidatus Ornithobacterium hominis TaxID=2497989 RepID=A0A383TX78_9FLAO|nr:helix-turn-helix transcriptional regulator [Candidatus Ornithobacterium hominis]MCT7904807.1 helix-turn-helix domain-containing protein [Candidatus Ornithobacterium hominis]MCT7905221.1 helix-turn-helix domain-containing protein [Candidatus Ornithobacterium hominis]SZD71576.1 Predicted transcriptional regulator [Candidatus Ornithobacterium hominis]
MESAQQVINNLLAKITQEELAKELGVSQSYISGLSSGSRNLSKNLAIKISDRFRLDRNLLLHFHNPKKYPKHNKLNSADEILPFAFPLNKYEMNVKEQIKETVKALKKKRLFKNQNEIAEHLGYNPSYFSRAINQDEVPWDLEAQFFKKFPKSEFLSDLDYKPIPSQGFSKTNPPVSEGEVIENKSGNKYYPNPNGGFTIEAPVVPFPAYASFVEVFEDEYKVHDDFSKAYFTVDHVGRGRYIGFRVTNESMNDGTMNGTPSGAEILGRELQRHHWKDGFKPTKYGWVIVTHTGILFKDIISNISENGTLKLHSRNPSPEYSDFDFEINKIHSIFKVIKRQF